MSVKYFTSSNQPVFKTSWGLSPATTLSIWTPGTGKSIVLTDLAVSLTAGTGGTIRFFFSTDLTLAANSTPVVGFVTQGSTLIKPSWDTPFIGTANQQLWVVAVGGTELDVTASGFEQD